MKITTVIINKHTELNAIQNRLSMVDESFELFGINDKITKLGETVFFDFTFDFFNPNVNPVFFYQTFANLQDILKEVAYTKPNFFVIRHYPYSCDISDMIYIQRIIDRFVDTLIEFFACKMILVPHIISRYSIKSLHNPVSEIIETVRMGKSKRIELSENSRISFIYDSDILRLFPLIINEHFDKNVVIEGIDISLKEVAGIAQATVGYTPITFDNSIYYKSHFPDMNAVYINKMNFQLNNIMVDLINNLF